MVISQKKKQALYDNIFNPIMDLRVELQMDKKGSQVLTSEDVDSKLYRLTEEIWERAQKTLNFSE